MNNNKNSHENDKITSNDNDRVNGDSNSNSITITIAVIGGRDPRRPPSAPWRGPLRELRSVSIISIFEFSI